MTWGRCESLQPGGAPAGEAAPPSFPPGDAACPLWICGATGGRVGAGESGGGDGGVAVSWEGGGEGGGGEGWSEDGGGVLPGEPAAGCWRLPPPMASW